jgi:hypothetical protein
MMPTLDDVRHRRGFGTALDRAVKTAARLEFDWPALERFQASFLPTIRDPKLRLFIEGVLDQRIGDHPLRQFTPMQAREINHLRSRWAWESRERERAQEWQE